MATETLADRYRIVLHTVTFGAALLSYVSVGFLLPDAGFVPSLAVAVGSAVALSFAISLPTRHLLQRNALRRFFDGPVEVVADAMRSEGGRLFVCAADGTKLAGPYRMSIADGGTWIGWQAGEVIELFTKLSDETVLHSCNVAPRTAEMFRSAKHEVDSFGELEHLHRAAVEDVCIGGLRVQMPSNPVEFLEANEEAERQHLATLPLSEVQRLTQRQVRDHQRRRW